ncbi:putative transcription factor GTE4 isoform X2 [Iris pallida]|uniref:Transcription factor GTE4 isoform X2 n=1 Tax=Iris pallida TaxID=29817 RepID=A0AAX6GJ30_IRIPA|nr:putative transcription factor GTE4 isoform X2 [Iris pallida]
MASGPLVGGSNGGNNDGGSREKHRWHESKVYTRKSFNKRSKPTQNPSSNPNPPPPSNNQTLASSAVSANDAADSPVRPPPPPPPLPAPPSNPSAEAVASDDDSSSLNRRPPLIQIRTPSNGERRVVNINLTSRSKHEVRHLRRKLVAELDQVRSLVRKLESKEHQVAAAAAAAAAASIPTPTSAAAANYSLSQFSANDVSASPPVALKRAPPMAKSEAASAVPLRRHLSVSVPEFSIEKEKRTPKANQYYRNSDFVLGKEKFPPVDSHKKSKSNGSKMVDHKLYNQAFKSCANLLQKLMKHKHGWVFNNPVDVKGLGLHDYYSIIRHPMDLGTVKSRLTKNWYKSPEEFAEDVRLTFRNAMTYNPKGQDVHVMAEQLSQIFEEQWPTIEAEYTYFSSPKPPVPAKRPPPPAAVIDTRRFLERSDSTVHPVAVESRPKPVSYPQPHISRPPPLKKPKAKDLHKRDMTFDEKQKLSNNLQNLPPEKLDNIVQIIKKRNSTLSQHDDEIEVDIDSVDAETLWELDRFVTNYKKSLSKNKRKAELARAQHHVGQERVQERVSDPVVHEVPKDIKTVADEKDVASSPPARGGKKGDNASGSSSSSSSSSGSGSSSSDSDSESSSACGSDAAQLPRT